MLPRRRFIDIAVNLADCVFVGVDRKGKALHANDLDLVVQRALDRGVERMIITGTTVEVSRQAVALCNSINERFKRRVCFCTVGVHPAHADEFLTDDVRQKFASALKKAKKKPQQAPAGTAAAAAAASVSSPTTDATKESDADPAALLEKQHAQKVVSELKEIIAANRGTVVALGECGLDFAELSPICSPRLQALTFQLQLDAAVELGVPLLLHSRACSAEFVAEYAAFCARHGGSDGRSPLPAVVHSFNGDDAELRELTRRGVALSLNGSAFRERGMALRLAGGIAPSGLCLETDAPWLSAKPTDWYWPLAERWLAAAMPPFVGKEDLLANKFELGMCVAGRNEPATLPLIFSAYCAARSEVAAAAASNSVEGSAMATASTEAAMAEGEQDALAEQIYNNTLRIFFREEYDARQRERQQVDEGQTQEKGGE